MEYVPLIHDGHLSGLLRSKMGSDQHVAMLAFVPSLRSHSPWHLVDGPPGTAVRAVDQFNVMTRDNLQSGSGKTHTFVLQ